jgi:TRAP-type C4-dicarboxylate transport system permease small subunit
MNLPLQPVLAFILFLPAFAVLGALYVLFPRRPRGSLRMIADVLVLLATAACSLWAMRRGFAGALETGGAMWAQIFASLVA